MNTKPLKIGLDYIFDQLGFNIFRYGYEKEKKTYKGFGKFLGESANYTYKHIPGEIVGRLLGGLATFAIAYFVGLPVYVAALAPRAVEIGSSILSNYFFTKEYRKELAQTAKTEV